MVYFLCHWPRVINMWGFGSGANYLDNDDTGVSSGGADLFQPSTSRDLGAWLNTEPPKKYDDDDFDFSSEASRVKESKKAVDPIPRHTVVNLRHLLRRKLLFRLVTPGQEKAHKGTWIKLTQVRSTYEATEEKVGLTFRIHRNSRDTDEIISRDVTSDNLFGLVLSDVYLVNLQENIVTQLAVKAAATTDQ